MYQVILLQDIKRDLYFSANAACRMVEEIGADNDIKVILLKIHCIEFGIDVIPSAFLRLWVNT